MFRSKKISQAIVIAQNEAIGGSTVTEHSTNYLMFKGSNIADSLKELPALVEREKRKKSLHTKKLPKSLCQPNIEKKLPVV